MSTVDLTLDEISALIIRVMLANGCDDENAMALADIMTRAERDGSHSHGLFRVPGYVKALRSGKVNGKAKPTVKKNSPTRIPLNGDASTSTTASEYFINEAGNCLVEDNCIFSSNAVTSLILQP